MAGQGGAADALGAGTVLRGNYRIERVLGQGAFGIVYLADELTTGRQVAVKEYYPRGKVFRRETDGSVRPPENAVPTAGIRQMGGGQAACENDALQDAEHRHGQEVTAYLEKAQLLQTLSAPGLVRMPDCFAENNTGYLVMEYLPGGSLGDYMRKNPKTGGKQAAEMLHRVMAAAEYLHTKGIVHCDISPDNLLFDAQGLLVAADLGAARFPGMQSRERALKEGYAPLEQYREKDKIGPWTDLYAVCAVWYEMVTGKRMVSASARMAGERLRRPSEFALVDAGLEQSFMQGLSPEIRQRYFSMGNLMQRLGFGEEADSGQTAAVPEKAAALRQEWGGLWLSITMEAGRLSRKRLQSGKIRRILRRIAAGAAGLGVLTACIAAGGMLYRRNHREEIIRNKMEKAKQAAGGRTAAQDEDETSSCFAQDVAFLEKYGKVTGTDNQTLRYRIDEEAAEKWWRHPSNMEARFYLDRETAREAAVYYLGLTGEKEGPRVFSGYASVRQEPPYTVRISLTSECSYTYTEGQLYLYWDYATDRVISMSFTGSREKAGEYLEKLIPILSPESFLTKEEVGELFLYEEEQGDCRVNLNERCYVSVQESAGEYLAYIHAN